MNNYQKEGKVKKRNGNYKRDPEVFVKEVKAVIDRLRKNKMITKTAKSAGIRTSTIPEVYSGKMPCSTKFLMQMMLAGAVTMKDLKRFRSYHSLGNKEKRIFEFLQNLEGVIYDAM